MTQRKKEKEKTREKVAKPIKALNPFAHYPPEVRALAEKEAQDEIFKTLFELTKQVEIIKKRLAKLEAKDESALL